MVTRLPIHILAGMVLMAGAALAGPNEGVVLTPHGNVNGFPTGGSPCNDYPIPEICADTDPNAAPDAGGVEWYIVLAAGESELGFTTIIFGIGDYDPNACYAAMYGPCFPELVPLEIPSDTWPGPFSGTAVSWAPECLQGMLVPVYFFGFYVYSPGGPVPLGDFYPGLSSTVVSCEEPPVEDVITGYGVMGCGDDPGVQVCPIGEGPGPACCVDTDGDDIPETCVEVTDADECLDLGGVFQGEGSQCGPNNEPCPQPPVATEQTTWSRIKATYR